MEHYKAEFIDFMVRSEVLTFGDFVTKSGRNTPYFVNTGRYNTGEQLARLGEFYADAIAAEFLDDGTTIDVLFGPAYKGIPLVATTAIALADRDRGEVGFAFNRKEPKDHGEGGVFVGHTFADGDRVLIIEDVTTAGTSLRETIPLLRAAAAVSIEGLVVSIDRCERGTGDRSALAEAAEVWGMKTSAIVTVFDVIEHLHNRRVDGVVVLDDERRDQMERYLDRYGPRS